MDKRERMDELADKIAAQAAHVDAATHELLAMIREFDEAGGWGMQHARSCAHWLSWRLGMSLGAAREHVRVAHRLAELPLVEEAMKRGALSYSKARAITRVATAENEATLMELAPHTSGQQMEVVCQNLRTAQLMTDKGAPEAKEEPLHRRVAYRAADDKGLVKCELWLAADEAALLKTVLDKRATARAAKIAAEEREVAGVPAGTSGGACTMRPHGFNAADAFVEWLQEEARGQHAQRSPVELIVVLDKNGHATTTSGIPLAPETAQRLGCDCAVVGVIEDDAGNPLYAGRKRRTINAALKRALLVRDRRCRFPGCAQNVFLDAHHVESWLHGGKTEISNLVMLCAFHHRCLHEYKFQARHLTDGGFEFLDDRGRRIEIVPPGRRAEFAAETPIDATTNQPKWDGTPLRYNEIMEDLLAVDGPPTRDRYEQLLNELGVHDRLEPDRSADVPAGTYDDDGDYS